MGLEKDTDALSQRDLEFVLALVLFFEDDEVFLVELVVIITFTVLLLVLGVLLDSVLRLLDELEDLLPEEDDALWLQKVGTSLLKDLLDGLSLGDEAVGFGLSLHSINDVVAEFLGHFVDDGNVVWSGFFSALQKTWEGTSTGGSNVVTSIELSKTQKNGADLVNVFGKTTSELFNEDNEHLKC